MQNKRVGPAFATKARAERLSAVSTIGLIVLMLIYLVMTLWSSNQLAGYTEIISEHPFEVVAAAGDLLRGRRLLVAEDNELNREIVVELLAMYGVVTECAVNGSEALQKFENAAPGYFDAILMDVQMPVMDGYEATRRIRMGGQPDAAAVPIIATTANAFSDDISLALAAGMNAHVGKPIEIDRLREVLAKALADRTEGDHGAEL